jgi:CO/xanthine dehydrogenase Mo-binding subunit
MSVSRRDFLKSSGVLIVSFGAGPLVASAPGQGPFEAHPSHIDPAQLDSWLSVSADGTVTARTGKCDFGQGMFTAQTQLVAEELSVPITRVKLVECDTDSCPDEGTTSGSQSTPANFNLRNLALAAATARETLLNMATKQLSVPADQLALADGAMTAKDGRRVTFEELIGNKRFHVALNSTAKRRSPKEWTVLGKPIPSLDRGGLMTGRFEFVHNIRVPGMLHGRMVRPPNVGATFTSVDESSVRNIPGVLKVVVRKNFVGVVAENQWQAIQAARELKVIWRPGTKLTIQDEFYEALRKQPSEDSLIVDSGDVEQQLTKAAKVMESTYVYPYQMHGSIGSSCAIADVKQHRATVWSATQSVYPTRSIVAKLLELPLENVRVIYVRGSGCYGLNGADTISFDAALMSEAVGRPVRVQLSRQDEMAWENYGAACVVHQRAATRQGGIIAWNCETWETSRGSRPGYDKPGNVITGTLVGYEPEVVQPHAASKPTGPLRNGGNNVPSYFAGCIGGHCGGAGNIRSERVLYHRVASPFYTGPLRSPLRLQNTFAHESFMDELGASVSIDSVEFRLRHLRDERLIDVVKAAAQAAQWEPRPPQRQPPSRSPSSTGRGIACVAYEGNNGYAALVSEVSVELTTGRVQPRKFVVAIDVGPISNPDGLRNQTEGGILQGTSRALLEEVSWDEAKITSTDWETYKSLYLDFEAPAIEIVLIDRPGVAATGAGELGITLVAAAMGNAIFDASGARLRRVPFTADRVKAALDGRRATTVNAS